MSTTSKNGAWIACYTEPEAEDLVTCPYDPTHRVRNKKMPYHLMKCQQNHRGQKLVICPFNALHEVPQQELRYHMKSCPERFQITQDLIAKESKSTERNGGNVDLPKYNTMQYSDGENWDDDEVQSGVFDLRISSFLGDDDVLLEKIKHRPERDTQRQQFNRDISKNDDYVRPPRVMSQAFAMNNQILQASGMQAEYKSMGRAQQLANAVEAQKYGRPYGLQNKKTQEMDRNSESPPDREDRILKQASYLKEISKGRGRSRVSTKPKAVGGSEMGYASSGSSVKGSTASEKDENESQFSD